MGFNSGFKGLIAVHCDNHMALINRLRGQNTEILSDKNEL